MPVTSVSRIAGALVIALAVVCAVFVVIRQPFSVVYPASELRSYDSLPTVIAFPAFHAGPIFAGGVADQEIRLTESDVAVRLWMGPAEQGTDARVRIELLAGLHGPSLRSGILDLADRSGPIVVRIVPPLSQSELPVQRGVILRVAPVAGSEPIRVGMQMGKAYPEGRTLLNGDTLPRDQAFMFEVARELSPGDIWRRIWTLVDSQTLPLRGMAVAGAIVLVTSLAAAIAEPHRRTQTAVVVGILTLLAMTLVVIDRTSMSFFPGPDFGPTVILR